MVEPLRTRLNQAALRDIRLTQWVLSVNGSFCDPYLPQGECLCGALNSQGQLRALLSTQEDMCLE
jgi:hypothetical protein